MSEFTISFGMNGSEEAWYLRNGPAGFRPIDISLLPGSKPAFANVPNQLVVSYTAEDFAGDFLYGSRVYASTNPDGSDNFDQQGDWNTVKNLQFLSDGAQRVVFDGFVHIDAEVGLADGGDSHLVLNGVKRANVITGEGDDVIDIRMVEDQNSVWVTTFRINSGAGDDLVSFKALDIAAELEAGDFTYVQARNKPGLPLVATGEGRTTFTALGAGDDEFEGFNSDDQVAGQTDAGRVEAVFQTSGPTGFAYSIGGNTGRGHVSKLYRIDLATGAATVVGPVKVDGAPGKSADNLDVESLSLNPVDGKLYGFVNSPGNVTGLIKVDPLTAATTYIGGVVAGYKSAAQDFAFGLDGKLYFASEGDLVSVNTYTGAFAIIGDNTLSKKTGALAFDPVSGKLFGLVESGSKTLLVEISKSTGAILSSSTVANLAPNAKPEGASFDSAGTLWAVDRVSGDLYKIDVATSSAQKTVKTLAVSQQTGDGFESLAIDIASTRTLVDLNIVGGDRITTGEGADRVNYRAGDGTDVVTDFDLLNDTLHIAGYTADRVRIDVFNGDTFIRFTDNSGDGFVDDAMIQLTGVTNFDASLIVYGLSTDFP